jgi:alkanesulfonate monooxygenase SsuD/methylene tetrahydromethanopterin reductase-like flavin-dependent oxidoreductase (luciferase family)
MDFGLIYELQTMEGRTPKRDYDLLWNSTAQVERADQLGFSHVWAVEHHFRENFSHCSAPEVWLSALAQRTENIRIGHGVVQALPAFNHPVRVAERAAALDILSNGRVDLGTGRSVNLYELASWGITESTRDMWRESVELIGRIWQSGFEPVTYHGEYVQLNDRVVLPRPLQDPHPPMWVAASSPDSYRLAGELGLGVIGFGMALDAEGMSRRVDEYRAALATGTPVGAFKNDQVAVFMMAYCAETRAEARRVAENAFNWYLDQSLKSFLGWAGSGQELPKGYEWYVDVASKAGQSGGAGHNFDHLLDGGMILCGTPDDLIETIERFEAIGTTEMLLGISIGDISHEDVLRSIELIGSEVIPHFTNKAALANAAAAGA